MTKNKSSCVDVVTVGQSAANSAPTQADTARLALVNDAQATDLALDADAAIHARNSLETMLAHQMATAHRLAMKFAQAADEWLLKASAPDGTFNRVHVMAMEQAQRSAHVSGRMMRAFDDGLLTLARVRGGGEQKVTVVHQHVQVAGGQVAVAGSIQTGTGSTTKGAP